MTESELLGGILERKRPGDRVSLTFLRDGTKKTVTYALP
jgi:S1-C subfamily serine protease